MLQKKILLVDDEEIIRKSFRKDFEFENYAVTTAVSGKEAITILENDRFDIVLTDLVMPGVDGIDVLKETKKLNPEAGTIILTGYGDMDSAIEALRLGADDYLLKPCEMEELLLRMTRCLEKKEALRKVKLYEKILPLCMYCKSIRDDTGVESGKGKWIAIEQYMLAKDGTLMSHTFCPQCREQAEKDMLGY
ncbi:response regulator [Desulfococcaceae bacterium HSG9]|nr:response regulator [Desulfococcaceae bacterium HSG9]